MLSRTPLLPFLLRLALLPSADNGSPKTESQLFRRVLTYVGSGFALRAVAPIQESAKSVGTKKGA